MGTHFPILVLPFGSCYNTCIEKTAKEGTAMTQYTKAHIQWLAEHEGHFTEEEMNYHLQMIAFLQHERFVHLPVMLVSILGFLAMVILCFFSPSLVSFLGVLLLLILSACYIKHYFFLENTVQDWYKIYTQWELQKLS